MIYIDGVIYALQRSGGVSVVFDEILSRLPKSQVVVEVPKLTRPWERYSKVEFDDHKSVFHSTYYRLPRGRAKGVVTTVHDFTYERFSSGPKKWVHSWQKRKAISGADTIICVSENTKKDLLEFLRVRDSQKVVVIPNGVSGAYKYLGKAVKEQVLFVGARGGYKNFKNAVLALSDISDVFLMCVGGGGFSKEEIGFLEYYMPGRYQHAGRITNEQLNICYNESICLVYPSLYEGFGIPVLEAMRAGCPVVAVDSSSIPEVAGEAALLLEAGCVEEIKNAINFFLLSENRNMYVERGFKRAKLYSWDETCRRTVEVYEDLLGVKL
ncbi:glycosyltransferase family 1 protein [Pseudomonas guariconensis]|uniref:glycosyltransferase family 4 protein n=1 Tax=Pseudomonas guariconensis TaxID=1288410 RepID=UPI0018D8A05A|nr:glycosyltransferase family 1 protein [Pseudomonas guariconensis]MBH3359956.1 glycosyltransferase family 4 protein [Pseudomonas guariconensis]MDM9595257.1 glycosyltransferase family 1 protein [Pseudomonas guariconensis]MDM9608086.1 glycosyltransferase family 1 protein [Pseudomonas guariconensis]MDM9613043.1 glycosyltransferase family 1 protein [Pseudomonas guariconensis]